MDTIEENINDLENSILIFERHLTESNSNDRLSKIEKITAEIMQKLDRLSLKNDEINTGTGIM